MFIYGYEIRISFIGISRVYITSDAAPVAGMEDGVHECFGKVEKVHFITLISSEIPLCRKL